VSYMRDPELQLAQEKQAWGVDGSGWEWGSTHEHTFTPGEWGRETNVARLTRSSPKHIGSISLGPQPSHPALV
jgi:hypothetical protein